MNKVELVSLAWEDAHWYRFNSLRHTFNNPEIEDLKTS